MLTPPIYERRTWDTRLIFDVVDGFARQRGLADQSPRPLGQVTFYALGEMVGGRRVDYASPLRLSVIQNPTGYHLFNGKVQRAKGIKQRDLLRLGTYVIRLESDYYLSAERADVAVPMPDPRQPVAFELQPSAAYPFPQAVWMLRGTLHQTDGSGIEGAIVSATIAGQPLSYVTSAAGDWLLALPTPSSAPTAPLEVQFTLPDGTVKTVTVTSLNSGAQRVTSVTQTAATGHVVDADGRDVASAVIAFPGFRGSTLSNSRGKWIYYFDLTQPDTTLTSITVNGQRLALTPAVQLQAGSTVHMPLLQLR